MRYVQVWFRCSAKDCEERAEMMVEIHHSLKNFGFVYVTRTLPEGWGHSAKDTATFINRQDRENTFCPMHCSDNNRKL